MKRIYSIHTLLTVTFLIFSFSFFAYSEERRPVPHSEQVRTASPLSLPDGHKCILFLRSYGYGREGPELYNLSFFSTLAGLGIGTDDVMLEYLDLNRNPDRAYRERLRNLLNMQYKKRKIDLIVAAEQPALNFLLRDLKDIAPDAPVMAINAKVTADLDPGRHRLIQKTVDMDFKGTLERALELFPETRRVMIITGAAEQDLTVKKESQTVAGLWRGKIEFEYTDDLSMEEILKRVAQLPQGTIVVYRVINKDKNGKTFIPYNALIEIVKAANAPVFGLFNNYVGPTGIVGGSVYHIQQEAEQAARLAAAIVNRQVIVAEKIETLASQGLPMFDWQQVKRWGGNVSNLPPQSIFVNRPSTLWEGHRKTVISSILAFVGLVVLVMALLVQNRRRKEVEKALVQTERNFRNSFDDSILGVRIVSAEGKTLYANRAFLSLYGFTSADELLATPVAMRYTPDSMTAHHLRREQRKRGGEGPPEYDIGIIRKNGEIKNLHVFRKEILWDGAKHFQVIYQDITARKRAEAALQESEVRFRELFNNMTSGVAVYEAKNDGADFMCKDINEAGLRMAGMTRKDIVGRYVTDVFPGVEEMGMLDVFRRVFRTGTAEDKPTSHYIDARLSHWYENHVYKLPSGEIVAVYDDVTNRMQAEQALRYSEGLRQAVFDSVKDFIFIKDLNRRYLLVNNFFQKHFHVDPESFIGKLDAEIPIFENKENTDTFVTNTDSQVLKGETVEYQLTHRICGTWITFDIIKTPLWDEQGNVAGICGLSRDVTERKRLEEERKVLEERLQRAEKMEALGTLAGGVAHDLNNVLGIVVGYSEMVLNEIEESSSIRPDVVQIMQGGERAAAIVQDLLTLARRGVQTKKVVNLNAAIRDCQNTPEFEKILSFNSRVRIQLNLEADLLNIMGSPVHLGKTVINLVSNAVEAMPEGGFLKITTNNQYLDRPIQGYDNIREGDYAVLSVCDSGEGISANDLKRIFEPFYTKKVMGRSGTGLGLAVVWGTVKDHNGYIDVQSEEGKGTAFTLYFPVTRDDASKEQTSLSLSDYMGEGESVLVVDDVKEQRNLATRMLSRLNYRVTSCASGEEAVAYFKTNWVDLVVLDMIMDPGMDGLDTYKNILEIHPNQKAIIVSGFSESERVKEAQALGAGAYIKKPYILERLGVAVRKELNRQ